MEKPFRVSLGQAVEVIRHNGVLRQIDLTALLGLDSREDRFEVNATLAHAYLHQGQLERAAIFADRAWLLADGRLDFLPAYLEIQEKRGDIERIRSAHKKTGMHFAAANNLAEALRHFNLHHYAYQNAGKGDHYEYDFDIMNAVEHLAMPYRAELLPQPAAVPGSKIRVAYLVFGATHIESVLIKMLCYFARYHDPQHFNVRFFVPDNPGITLPYARPHLQSNLQKLTTAGAHIEMAQAEDEMGNLLEIAGKMADFDPDLLVTTAALADYRHFFLACTRPAPVRIGLVYGPPEQYAPPDFDWVVTATRHPLIDSPCGGTLVPVEIDLPKPATIAVHRRSDFGIPGEATLIVIVGRPEKFISPEYWQALSDILFSSHEVRILCVGIKDIPEDCVQHLAPSVLPRLKFAGYRADYLQILAMADIVLDTFPSGGGIVLLDTMALGIPVVTFRNDYSRKYDQTQWSPAEELFDVTELIAPHGDFVQFTILAGELVANPAIRREMGKRCRESVQRLNGRPERMVQRCETVYRNALERKRDTTPPSPPTVGIWNPLPKRVVTRPLWRRALSRARRMLSRLQAAERPLWRRVLSRARRMINRLLGRS